MKNSTKNATSKVKVSGSRWGERKDPPVIKNKFLPDDQCLLIQKAILAANKDATTAEMSQQISRFAEASFLASSLALSNDGRVEMQYLPKEKEWRFKAKGLQ